VTAPQPEPAAPAPERAPPQAASVTHAGNRRRTPTGMLELQRLAGNAAVNRLLAVQRLSLPTADVEEDHSKAGDSGGEGVVPGPQGPEAEGEKGGAGAPPVGAAGADEAEESEGEEAPAEAPVSRQLAPEDLDVTTAGVIADLAQAEGTDAASPGEPNPLLDPALLQAAARLLPDRAQDLGFLPAQRRVIAPTVQRADTVVQRKGTVPTKKVKVTLPGWQNIKLFTDRNVGQWFLLSGAVESPTWEGTAKPPGDIRDDTTEQELQMTADGKVTGYAATLHKETLGKVGDADIEGKLQVEVNDKGAVKVTGLTVQLPNYGPEGTLLTGQYDFDIFEWEPGAPPSVMALSYTMKIGSDSTYTKDGWTMNGQLYLPIKLTIKPNPVKLAEYVARVVAPRLIAAAPAGLAIGAPLAVGAVLLAIYADAVRAGEDFGVAVEHATANTKGYVQAYVGTIFGHPIRWSNAGATRGKADAQRVLDAERWNELPEGAKAEIRKRFEDNPGFLKVPSAQSTMWSMFRDQAIASYREKNPFDAWMYDRGWGGNLGKLYRVMAAAGPPWNAYGY
jgi:hypothetical protein